MRLGQKKSIPSVTNWHHKACQVMVNNDREGWIFLYHPYTNNKFFFLFTIKFHIHIYLFTEKLAEVPDLLRCDKTWLCHFYISMTSLVFLCGAVCILSFPQGENSNPHHPHLVCNKKKVVFYEWHS